MKRKTNPRLFQSSDGPLELKILGPESRSINTGKSIFGPVHFKFPDLDKRPVFHRINLDNRSIIDLVARRNQIVLLQRFLVRFWSSFWSGLSTKDYGTNPYQTVRAVTSSYLYPIIEKYQFRDRTVSFVISFGKFFVCPCHSITASVLEQRDLEDFKLKCLLKCLANSIC